MEKDSIFLPTYSLEALAAPESHSAPPNLGGRTSMDASKTPAQPVENQEQSRPFTTDAAPSNPGAVSLFYPYAAAAAAAIAVANQQMAQQSMQSHAPQQPAYSPPPTNSNLQPARTSALSLAAPSVNKAQPNAASAHVPSAQSASASGVASRLSPFAFSPHQFAALLGGGFPAATPAVQRNSGIAYNKALSSTASSMAPPPVAIQSMPHAAMAAAAAQVVAAHAATASSGAMANSVFANMQNWKLDQLESHVQLLRDTNQSTPEPVALLLADARRKQEKRTAKRVANRQSASSSRARKKAFIDKMTNANARLRRQAMILNLLPDLVIAVTVDGKITFCSAQVERVLRHQVQHLVGANFEAILTPSSREKIRQLVGELVAADQAATINPGAEGAISIGGPSALIPNVKLCNGENGSGKESSGCAREIFSGGEVVPVSEQSFPLKVVEVESPSTSAEDNSSLSASNGGGKPATTTQLSSYSFSSFGHCGDDEAAAQRVDRSGRTVVASDAAQVKSDVSSESSNPRAQAQTSSDDSFCSSNDAKNLRKANEALGRNVRWHNENLARKANDQKKKASHQDDVTGASVIANNAGARLSSLLHRTESPTDDKEPTRKRKAGRMHDGLEDQCGNGNASDDSGYRESNESLREDSFSTSDDSSSLRNGPRPKPLAPACNVCLIRNDLTTIWCEVTSSIRTRSLKDDDMVGEALEPLDATVVSSERTQSASKESKDTKDPSSTDEDVAIKDEIEELLLCLRPIRDGEETVDESLRFVPSKNIPEVSDPGTINEFGPYTSTTSSDGASKGPGSNRKVKRRPPKKRPVDSDPFITRASSSSLRNVSDPMPGKKRCVQENATEKCAVESLILMGNKNAR